jgi:hypothetical protein
MKQVPGLPDQEARPQDLQHPTLIKTLYVVGGLLAFRLAVSETFG